MVVGTGCSLLTFVITSAANVPLNRRLDEAPADTEVQRGSARRLFEGPWNQWNLARSVTSVGSLAALAAAALSL